MKGVDIFCASQAATSICLSMEQISSSTSSPSTTTLLGGAAVDRHNPIIRDSKRTTTTTPKPTPPPTSKLHPKKKNNSRIDENHENLDTAAAATATAAAIGKRSWSCTKPGDFLSPPGSTRYLLREKVNYNTHLSDSDPTKSCVEESSNKDIKREEPTLSDIPEQVVVMRVSLHCRGCEKKLRKHLSRMEGVKSFDIDFLTRKVTVAGNVTPSDLVSNISKVMKNAQLWSPSISSSNPIMSHDNNIVGT